MSDAPTLSPAAAAAEPSSGRRSTKQQTVEASERVEKPALRFEPEPTEPAKRGRRAKTPDAEILRVGGEVRTLAPAEEGARAATSLKPVISEAERSLRAIADAERPLEGYRLHNGRYRDGTRVVFVDRGAAIESFDETVKTVRAVVALAEHKGWRGLDVTGSAEFQRQMYVEGAARGLRIALADYVPTQADRNQATARALERTAATGNQVHELPSAISQATTRTLREVEPAAHPVQGAILVETGRAPYGFRTGADESFFARTKQDDGRERVVWGKGLEAAIRQAEAKPGDRVTIEKTGAEPVQVDGRRQGESGRWQPTVLDTQRNQFKVDVVHAPGDQRQTPPSVALEQLLREREVPQVTIDRVLKAFARAERLEAARGTQIEARGYDISAPRGAPIPSVQIQTEHAKTRVR